MNPPPSRTETLHPLLLIYLNTTEQQAVSAGPKVSDPSLGRSVFGVPACVCVCAAELRVVTLTELQCILHHIKLYFAH